MAVFHSTANRSPHHPTAFAKTPPVIIAIPETSSTVSTTFSNFALSSRLYSRCTIHEPRIVPGRAMSTSFQSSAVRIPAANCANRAMNKIAVPYACRTLRRSSLLHPCSADQIVGPISEQITTSGLASAGVRPTSQIGSAVMPVLNPVSPETRPPANAPTSTSSEAESIRGRAGRALVVAPKVPCGILVSPPRNYLSPPAMPLTADKGSELVEDLNRVLHSSSRYPSPDEFWFRRMLSEANKLKTVNEIEAYNVLAQLYGLVGDVDTARRFINTAILLGGGPLLQINKAVILSNLGYFSEAVEPFVQGINPRAGLFTSRWRLGLALGRVHTLQDLVSQSVAINLEHIDSVDTKLISKMSRLLDEISMTDDQLTGLIDTVGEVLRENRLFFAGDGPEMAVWDDDPLEQHVSFMFALPVPVSEAVELDEQLGHRLFEKHGDLPPELIIHFESSFTDNEHIAERPALSS